MLDKLPAVAELSQCLTWTPTSKLLGRTTVYDALVQHAYMPDVFVTPGLLDSIDNIGLDRSPARSSPTSSSSSPAVASPRDQAHDVHRHEIVGAELLAETLRGVKRRLVPDCVLYFTADGTTDGTAAPTTQRTGAPRDHATNGTSDDFADVAAGDTSQRVETNGLPTWRNAFVMHAATMCSNGAACGSPSLHPVGSDGSADYAPLGRQHDASCDHSSRVVAQLHDHDEVITINQRISTWRSLMLIRKPSPP